MMLRILIYTCVLMLGTAVAAGPLERKLIYQTDPTHSPAPNGYLEHQMRTPDGERIVIWSSPPAPRRATIVYFHGNAGTLANRIERFRIFSDQGFGVIAMAYRGYSGSTGKPSQKKIVADARQLLGSVETYGASKHGGIALYGESIGAAVVAQIADNGTPYRAVVLEAPFTSVPDLAKHLLPKMAFASHLLSDKWNSARAITKMENRPLLVLHGTHDTLIPVAMGQSIVDAASTTNKRLYSVQDAGHLDVWQPETIRVMLSFLRTH